MATVLEIAQRACKSPRIALDAPSEVYSSSATENIQLAELMNVAAKELMRAHSWQKLRRLHTMTGDGTTETFALPTDYDRMVDQTHVWGTRDQEPMEAIASVDEWLRREIQTVETITDAWIIYGDEIHIRPAMGASDRAQYWYVSENYCLNSLSVAQPEFSADDDTFRLDDELLRLGLIWHWREAKGLAYAEDMATYELQLSKRIMHDKGARTLTMGRGGLFRGGQQAYPWALENAS